MHVRALTKLIAIVVKHQEMSSRPQTPVKTPTALQHTSLLALSTWRRTTRARTGFSPVCRIWLMIKRPLCHPSAVTTSGLDVDVIRRSSCSSPLRLFRRWSRCRRPPPPGRAPPSAAPRLCRPWTPTRRRPPAAPACAAAVRSPGRRPRWVYVRMWVKENLFERNHHCLLHFQRESHWISIHLLAPCVCWFNSVRAASTPGSAVVNGFYD